MCTCVNCKSEESVKGEDLCGGCKALAILEKEDDIKFDSEDPKNKDFPFIRMFSLLFICMGVFFYHKP